MTGDEVIAALKGIVNSTTLRDIEPDLKAPIRRLLQIIELNLTTHSDYRQF